MLPAPVSSSRSPSRRVSVSMATLLLGLVAVVATTMALCLAVSSPSSSPTANKFASRPVAASRRHQARAATRMDFGEDAGVLPPVGYLDPLGFGKKASADRLRWFRESELKHGRIAMLASVGFLIGENPELKDAVFPGRGSELSSHILTDHNLDSFWWSFFLGAGILETAFYDKFDSVLDWKLKKDYAVGDLGFDPLNLKPDDPAIFQDKRNKELQNGRLAMLALAGFNAQEMTDGKPIWPLHGIGGASAEELNAHLEKGLDLVKEMGQVLAETAQH